MVRKNLCKLVEHVNMLNLHCTEKSPEYILLEHILTDEMVDICLSMKIRTPYTIEEIAKRSKKSVDTVRRCVDEMGLIGFIEFERKDGVEYVKLPLFAPGSMELMMMNAPQVEEHPEIADAFVTYVENLTKNFARFFPKGNGLVITVPVQKAIQAEPKRIGIEEISYWVEKYAPSLSVTGCQCRRAARVRGNIGEDLEGEWCIQLGEFAESCIKTKRSRRVTKEEVYEILQKAEDLGYVHEVTNVDGPTNSLFICNCHPECCLGMVTARLIDTPNMMKSNFVAEVDKEKCVACGQCVEVCPMNTVKLGEALCQANPVEVKFKPIPDNHTWGKEMWTENFRDNKQDVIPETGTAPCKTNCPAHISVQAYLHLAGQGRYLDALELIKKENPLPAVCGRICNRRCEQACTMNKLGDPVAIDEVKKFIADQELDSEKRFVPKKKFDHGEKVAVIGSGPAGLSCAYYLAVLGHTVTVFEKEKQLGGMLRYGIPSFRLEKDILDAEIAVLEELGVSFQCSVNVGSDVTLDSLRAEGFKGFYLAIGAQKSAKLNIPGENLDGVYGGVDFLREVNLGNLTTIGKRVVVIGGGNVAMDVARTAVRLGSDVTVVYRRKESDMPADPAEVAEAKAEGVKFLFEHKPLELVGTDGKVTELKCENDSCEVDAVIAAIGQRVDLGALADGLKLTEKGLVAADGFTYQTSIPDVFVGGDVFTGPKFAIDAIAAGKEGANSLHRHVHPNHSLTLGRDRRIYKEIDKENLILESYDRPARQSPAIIPENHLTFKDSRKTLTEEQVKLETSRCLGCGVAVVDPSRCLGCGLCTTRCKFDAITLHKVSSEYGTTYEKLPLRLAGAITKRAGRIAGNAIKDAVRKGK